MMGFDDFYRKAIWYRSFAWLPHRCIISGDRIWLKFAYEGAAMWTGPGEPAIETHWHTDADHIVWCVKNA